MRTKLFRSLIAVIFCMTFTVAPALAPEPVSQFMGVEAQAGFLDKVKKSVKGVKKGVGKALHGKNGGLGKALTIVGAGAIGAGLITGKAGPVIIGLGLVAAPIVFRDEMERKYGREQSWAGCLTCGKKRVLVQPGRSISNAEQRATLARIKEDVKDTQRALKTLGYYKKGIDGDFGRGSRLAAQQFQQSINVTPTGTLTASERAQLFKLAGDQGFEPKSDIVLASLRPVTQLPAKAMAPVQTTVAAAAIVSSLKNYKLAESQVSKFGEDVLMFGGLSEVQSVELRPDGLLEISLKPSAGVGPVVGGVETITVAPHELSDEWALVTMDASDLDEEVILNTVDSFASGDEALGWIAGAQKKIALLEKLTERNTPEAPKTLMVEAPAADEPASSDEETVVAQAPSAGAAEKATIEAVAVEPKSDGSAVTPVTDVAQTDDVDEAVTPDETVEVAQADTSASERQCLNSLYVSFRFPEGFERVNHYNITTPESAFMTDNGDGTGYLTGSCIQGEYGYKYVVVNHDEAKKTYSSTAYEGSFEIASLAGNCEINLNDPTQSASMSCY